MSGEDNENVKKLGEAKVLVHRKQVAVAEESENNHDCSHALNSSLIHLFDVPTLNSEANAYYELANFDSSANNLQQLIKAAGLAVENSHLFYLVLDYFAMK